MQWQNMIKTCTQGTAVLFAIAETENDPNTHQQEQGEEAVIEPCDGRVMHL